MVLKVIQWKNLNNLLHFLSLLLCLLGGAWFLKPLVSLSGELLSSVRFFLFLVITPLNWPSGWAFLFLCLLRTQMGLSGIETGEEGATWWTSGTEGGDLSRHVGSFFGRPLFLFCPIGTLLTWDETSNSPCLL